MPNSGPAMRKYLCLGLLTAIFGYLKPGRMLPLYCRKKHTCCPVLMGEIHPIKLGEFDPKIGLSKFTQLPQKLFIELPTIIDDESSCVPSQVSSPLGVFEAVKLPNPTNALYRLKSGTIPYQMLPLTILSAGRRRSVKSSVVTPASMERIKTRARIVTFRKYRTPTRTGLTHLRQAGPRKQGLLFQGKRYAFTAAIL